VDEDPRRQHKRMSCNARFNGGGASTSLHGRITDLSGTGLFLVTKQFIPIGKQVHLEFELETGKVDAVGEVRWIARGSDVPDQGMGIRFLRLSASSARAIDDAIEGT
jgi:Tfp pilus assembly protein PilZ